MDADQSKQIEVNPESNNLSDSSESPKSSVRPETCKDQ